LALNRFKNSKVSATNFENSKLSVKDFENSKLSVTDFENSKNFNLTKNFKFLKYVRKFKFF